MFCYMQLVGVLLTFFCGFYAFGFVSCLNVVCKYLVKTNERKKIITVLLYWNAIPFVCQCHFISNNFLFTFYSFCFEFWFKYFNLLIYFVNIWAGVMFRWTSVDVEQIREKERPVLLYNRNAKHYITNAYDLCDAKKAHIRT